ARPARRGSASADEEGGSVMATREAAPLPANVPALTAERPVVWPQPTHHKFSSDLEVVLLESRTVPKFTREDYLRSGNAAAASTRPGMAEMTSAVVRTGTSRRTSRQIEEDLRRMGADLGTHAGADTSVISFSGLSEFAGPLLELVSELAREASFPAE